MEVLGHEFGQGVGVVRGVGTVDGLIELGDLALGVERPNRESKEQNEEEFVCHVQFPLCCSSFASESIMS